MSRYPKIKVSFDLERSVCFVDKLDPKNWPETISGNTALWYEIKKQLVAQGYDVVKKLMYKDGHMVSDTEYYVRHRKWLWAIWDGGYAIRFTATALNACDSVRLMVADWRDL